MRRLVLVDTSAWTRALRAKADPDVKARVDRLMQDEVAATCGIVRLELWNGVRGAAEQAALGEIEASLVDLPIDADVWRLACHYAARSRSRGLIVPSPDLLIFACARTHRATIEHVDKHYEMLESAFPS